MKPTSELNFVNNDSITILIKTDDSYGPIKGAQPQGTTWATNFPHTAWSQMSQYYITAFKTGTYPAITVRTILAFKTI